MKIFNYIKKNFNKDFLKISLPIVISGCAGVLCAVLVAFSPSIKSVKNNSRNYEDSSKDIETEASFDIEKQEKKNNYKWRKGTSYNRDLWSRRL